MKDIKVSRFSARIPLLFLLLALVMFPVRAQTSHIVEATINVFTPDQLTISTGDTVIWINQEGSHNVNGTQETYPSNPESFGNEVGAGWTYSHVFNLPGTYDYRCDPHYSLGMTGQIVVEGEATAVVSPNAFPDMILFPNPARDQFFLKTDRDVESVILMNMNGKMISRLDGKGGSMISFSLEGVPSGIYMVEIVISDHHRILKPVIKK